MADRRAQERRDEDRVLPHSLDAERAVLGALLLSPGLFGTLPAGLTAATFYRDAHRRVFRAMATLHEAQAAIDYVTLRDELTRVGDLDHVGGPAYLSNLIDGVPRASNVDHYAAIVIGHATRRATIYAANRLAALHYAAELVPESLVVEVQREALTLSSSVTRGGLVSVSSLIPATMSAMEQQHGGHTMVVGVPTGFTDVDQITGGLQDGDLCILAARPSVGKTSLALQIAYHAALGRRVIFFSLEMQKQQLMTRLVCGVARVSSYQLRAGFLDAKAFARIGEAAGAIDGAALHIDDTPGLTVEEVRATARRARLEHGEIGLIVVDYLQLLKSRGRYENRQQEVTAISMSLKQCARELNCPMLALSQLSRAPEGRKGGKPQLSDLRESGSLEQDADVVLLLWRKDDEAVTEVIVGKQRNGPTGVVKLTFVKDHTWFEDYCDEPGGS